MKKIWILALSLLMVLTLLVACKGTENPADTNNETTTDTVAVTEPKTEPETELETDPETEQETEPETEPETEHETETSVEETVDVDAILDDVKAANGEESLTNFRMDTKLVLDILMSMNGMENKMTMTGGLSLIQQTHEAMSLELNVPTKEPYGLTYIDGVLYVMSEEGRYRCPLDEVEMALVWADLMGDLFPTDELPDNTPEEEDGSSSGGAMGGLLPAMKLSAFFKETAVVTDETTGDTTILLEGISQQAQFLINMMISSMDKPEVDGISDMDMSLVLDMLAAFDMDALSVSLTVDEDMLIKAASLTMAVDMTNAPDLTGNIPMTLNVTLSTTLDRGEQTVTPPADADAYEETDWRTLFGFYTPEMLGLVPNEQGVVTLSEDPETFALQYDYMMEHAEAFEDVTLSVTARGCDFMRNEDGTVQGTIYQVYEDGTPADDPYLYVLIPADTAEGMTLPSDGSIVKLTATLVTDAEDEPYYRLIVSAYELISGPVAVG